MNRILTIVLMTGTLTLQVVAKRNSDGVKAGTSVSSGISSGVTTETSPAPTRTAPGYSMRTPSMPTPASPFAAPATPRTYTPSTPVYRGESYKGRSEKSATAVVQPKVSTRSETPATSPFVVPVNEETRRERTAQQPTAFSSRERTARPDDSQRVRITPPSRIPSRTVAKDPSPFLFNESATQPTTPAQKAMYSRHERTNHELTAQRRPEPVRSVHHHPETRSYYSHHYPSHHHNYRPVTCYSERDAFWSAFGFALAAPLVAPLYVASTFAPYPYYPTRTVTTTWGNDHFSFSVSTRSTYPVYTYRPYYCTSSWYYHDGWQHSYVYYGGWRSSWYGGFSYTFNPYPVYRTYYLYEEPQTVVIQQPAQQVVIYNQPAQPVVQNQDFVATPAPAATATPSEQPAVAEQPERCLCACKCNGKVPCICEYACGSEFAYSPEAYTLGDFASYSESLNTELIWSSYAGLDRAEAIGLVAEAGE